MAGILARLFGRRGPGAPGAEWQAARAAVLAQARAAMVFRVGGARPPDSRAASWWGGNFIAEPPRPGLVPLVQLRAADLPPDSAALVGADYLLVWLDPGAVGDEALEIETHAAPDPTSLPPTERACRMAGALATLPLLPERAGPQLPHWEDLDQSQVPAAMRGARDTSWLFDAPQIVPEDEEPVTVGGWPQWIQGSGWPEAGEFVMEIRSSEKGRLNVGDAGSFYLFRGPQGWRVLFDCF